MPLIAPFDYRSLLIGEEVIYRALCQREKHADEGKYGATWTRVEADEKCSAYFRAQVLRTHFTIPADLRNCTFRPPCHWRKEKDVLRRSDLMPVIMATDASYSYTLAVFRRTDSAVSSYEIGAELFSYTASVEFPEENARAEFICYSLQERVSDPKGPAVFVVRKLRHGRLVHQYHYLFAFE